MTPARLQHYNAAIEHSGLLAPAGMFELIDMQRLTHGAPPDAVLLCSHHHCSFRQPLLTSVRDPHLASAETHAAAKRSFLSQPPTSCQAVEHHARRMASTTATAPTMRLCKSGRMVWR